MMTTSKEKTLAMALAKDSKDNKLEAQISLGSDVNAALVISEYAKSYWEEPDLRALMDVVGESIDKVHMGNLKRSEAMLMGQAFALQSIFVTLSLRANKQENLKAIETFTRLALKAQSQCRTTLETLANIKNPPVIYAKQANIANGHQQINNDATAPMVVLPTVIKAPEKLFSPNELLMEDSHAALDNGRATETITAHTPMEAMAAVNRR